MASLKENYNQLKSDLVNFKRALSFTAALPRFLRERITPAQAEEQSKRLLDSRVERFLELARAQIYARPQSPYLRLLKHAGCEFSDLQASSRHNGLDRTLEQLASEGVYLTADEFKGKKELVRGNLSFRVQPDAFDNPDCSPGFVTQSSGSSNRPISTANPLHWIRLANCFYVVGLNANGLLNRRFAVYDAILPGPGGVLFLLTLAQLGIVADRWFARKIPINNWLEGQYHLAMTHLIVMMGKMFGAGFPTPRLLDPADTSLIVRWSESVADQRQSCVIRTVVSNAVRIARAALDMGTSLAGTRFIVSGEPLTDSKAEIIRRAGADFTMLYGYSGPFTVGMGCARPSSLDEMHVDENMLAVIDHPKPLDQDNPPIHPLLITTLDASTPKLQLNVANGDFAILERRKCGCALERCGLTLHLSRVRSYEKFTSEGMNYSYGDLYELFERTLPTEFGGRPGDYQLVEEEDDNGQTRLTLTVHPDVGTLDEAKLLERFRAALGDGSRNNRFMTGVWQEAGTFRVKRAAPYASPRGKILPLHLSKQRSP